MSKAAVRQKRGGTLSRSSSLIEDTLKQVGKRQALYMEEHVCTIFRVTLNPGEQFSSKTALSYVDKYRGKRQAHCTGRFLEDRMTLTSSRISGKPPFRSWVGYREIESIFVSKTKPQYFVLCINSETSNQRYYEIYKCKDPKTTSRVERLLNHAFADPNKIVRNIKSRGEVQCTNDMDRVRSLSTFELQRDSEIDDEINGNAEEDGQDEAFEVEKIEGPTQIETIEQVEVQQQQEQPQQDEEDVLYSRTGLSIENIKDEGDITYISFHPTRGPVINTVGPIYLFASTSPNRTYATGEMDLQHPIINYAAPAQNLDLSSSPEHSMANPAHTSTLDLRNTDGPNKLTSSIDDDLDAEKSHHIKVRSMKSSNVTSDSEGSVVDSYTTEHAVYNGYRAA